MTVENFRNVVNTGGERYRDLLCKMHVFNSNVVGSNSYFYGKRKELESLIEAHGMPTCWFTLSAADNHWHDLHNMLYNTSSINSTTSYSEMTEKEKTRFRVSMINRYQHLVDQFFYTRVQFILEAYLSLKII